MAVRNASVPVPTISGVESFEHERRHVIEYLEGQCRGEETVTRAEKVTAEHVGGTEYEVWDVLTDKTRWWVVTPWTNLYPNTEFKSMHEVISMHIGLMQRVFAREARQARASDEERDRLQIPWRKWEQAGKALEESDEAEEFQAVGMRCREALLAFIGAVASDDMVPEAEEIPQRSNFIRWSQVIAAELTPNSERLRNYLRKSAANSWELVSWLTHETNSNKFDATIALDATGNVLSIFGMALVRFERGAPERCPACASYRLATDYQLELDAYVTICEACGWKSAARSANHSVGATD